MEQDKFLESPSQREAWLASLLEKSPNPFLEISLDGRIAYMNPAIRILFPTLEEQETNHPYLANWGEVAERLQNQPSLVINRETEVEKDVYQQSIQFDEEYQLVRVFSMNITRRKQEEQALQTALQNSLANEEVLRARNEELSGTLARLTADQSTIAEERQRYRDLFDFAPDAYLVTDLEGKILEANLGAINLLGLDGGNEEGSFLINFIKVEERQDFRIRLVELADESSSLQRIPDSRRNSQNWEVRMQQQSGDSFDAAVTVAVFSGQQDEACSLRWSVRNISDRKRAERALKESEKRLRTITENAPGFIAELDLQGNFLYVNHGTTRYSLEELTGVPIYEVTPMEFHDGIRNLLNLTISSGEMQAAEFSRVVDGKEYWQATRFAPVFGPNGVERIVFIGTDISQQKWADAQLRISEMRFRTALENLLDGFGIFSTVRDDQGRIIDIRYEYINRAGSKIIQKPKETYLGQTLAESSTNLDRMPIIQQVIRLINTGQPLIQENFESPFSGMIIDLQAFRLSQDELAVSWRDVTERVRQQKALQEAEEFTRLTLNSLTEHIAILDETGKILWVNQSWTDFALANQGYPAKTGVGNNYLEVCEQSSGSDAEYGKKAAQGIRLAISGKTSTFQMEYPCSSENVFRWFVLRVTTFSIGDSQRVVVAHQDISLIKQYEQAIQKSEARLRLAMDSAQMAPLEYNFLTEELNWDERTKNLLWGVLESEPLSFADLLQILDPDDRQRARAAFIYHRLSGGANDFDQEMRLLWPQGKVQWIALKGKVTFEDDGQGQHRPVLLTGVVRDITEQKTAAEALRYNEALLRKVLEILPVGLWITDKNQKIMMGNPEGLRIWAAKRYAGVEEDGEFNAWRFSSSKRIEEDEWAGSLAVKKGKTTLNEELEIEAFDGTRRIILNSSIPIITDEDGLVGAILVNQDITRLKQDEEELQKAHDQLATLLDISQNILSMLDIEHLLHLILEQLEKVLPYQAAAILSIQRGYLKFQAIRGPSVFKPLENMQIPLDEPTLIDPLLRDRQVFYLEDLRTEKEYLAKIQRVIQLPPDQFAHLRSWLGVPLVAKDVLVGLLVLAHPAPDFYSPHERVLAQTFANQVAIAIHNAQLYQQAGVIAAIEERNRLARELHDSVAQALYSIGLYLDAARRALTAGRVDVANQHLGELSLLSREAMSNMRLLIFELRPPVLEKDGLAAALQTRFDMVENRVGYKIVFEVEGDYQFTPEEEAELYRIALEALSNVIKHSQANQVKVRLIQETSNVGLSVEDNGIGFDPTEALKLGGQGIRNMKERAAKIGAICRIESAPGQGTKVIVELKK